MKLSMIDPDLRHGVRRIPPIPYGRGWARRLARGLLRLMPASRVDGVTREIRDVMGVRLHIYRPEVRQSRAALLWIHGGGFIIGGAIQDDRFCAETCRELGIVIVSVDYRLAPEHPFPAALDDCHRAWSWLRDSAEPLGIDPARIVIGGQSAGGGLAATLVQRVHDGDGPGAAAQWLFSPMLDDRTAADRTLDPIEHRVWSNRSNAIGWRAYLGRAPGAAGLPDYAVAARRRDLGELPPGWIGVGDIDLFHDEDRAYAERLRAAGVEVAFVTVPGAPHGFEAWAADSRPARAFIAVARAWLRGFAG